MPVDIILPRCFRQQISLIKLHIDHSRRSWLFHVKPLKLSLLVMGQVVVYLFEQLFVVIYQLGGAYLQLLVTVGWVGKCLVELGVARVWGFIVIDVVLGQVHALYLQCWFGLRILLIIKLKLRQFSELGQLGSEHGVVRRSLWMTRWWRLLSKWGFNWFWGYIIQDVLSMIGA